MTNWEDPWDIFLGTLLVVLVVSYNIPCLVQVCKTHNVRDLNYLNLGMQIALNTTSLAYAVHKSLVPYYISNTGNILVTTILLVCKHKFQQVEQDKHTSYEQAWLSYHNV